MSIEMRELYTTSTRMRYGDKQAYAFKVPVEEIVLGYVRAQELPATADGADCKHAYLDPNTRVVVVTLEKHKVPLGYLLVPLELVLESSDLTDLLVSMARAKNQPAYKTYLARAANALSALLEKIK